MYNSTLGSRPPLLGFVQFDGQLETVRTCGRTVGRTRGRTFRFAFLVFLVFRHFWRTFFMLLLAARTAARPAALLEYTQQIRIWNRFVRFLPELERKLV